MWYSVIWTGPWPHPSHANGPHCVLTYMPASSPSRGFVRVLAAWYWEPNTRPDQRNYAWGCVLQ